MSFAVFASSLVVKLYSDQLLGRLLKEGFFASGLGLSMWKPINTFLYDWWPLKELAATYSKISQVPVELVKTQSESDGFTFGKNIIGNPDGNKIA
ncbi:MAG: hypothetical protein R2827_12785 [Bdellovibrionales bacterium]